MRALLVFRNQEENLIQEYLFYKVLASIVSVFHKLNCATQHNLYIVLAKLTTHFQFLKNSSCTDQKFLLQKFLQFEQDFGNDLTIEYVKKKAMEYVEKNQ